MQAAIEDNVTIREISRSDLVDLTHDDEPSRKRSREPSWEEAPAATRRKVEITRRPGAARFVAASLNKELLKTLECEGEPIDEIRRKVEMRMKRSTLGQWNMIWGKFARDMTKQLRRDFSVKVTSLDVLGFMRDLIKRFVQGEELPEDSKVSIEPAAQPEAVEKCPGKVSTEPATQPEAVGKCPGKLSTEPATQPEAVEKCSRRISRLAASYIAAFCEEELVEAFEGKTRPLREVREQAKLSLEEESLARWRVMWRSSAQDLARRLEHGFSIQLSVEEALGFFRGEYILFTRGVATEPSERANEGTGPSKSGKASDGAREEKCKPKGRKRVLRRRRKIIDSSDEESSEDGEAFPSTTRRKVIDSSDEESSEEEEERLEKKRVALEFVDSFFEPHFSSLAPEPSSDEDKDFYDEDGFAVELSEAQREREHKRFIENYFHVVMAYPQVKEEDFGNLVDDCIRQLKEKKNVIVTRKECWHMFNEVFKDHMFLNYGTKAR